MSIKSKAVFVGKLIGVSALFVVLAPVMAFAVVAGMGGHSSKDDLQRRRKWTVQQLNRKKDHLSIN
jgi:hypothetical protein